ncbi:MAG: PAS domain S-box protein [Deltaproteobacteria bacterium]|nr:PAS domain S-box protein [Deltaproteobacteria bacterium]
MTEPDLHPLFTAQDLDQLAERLVTLLRGTADFDVLQLAWVIDRRHYTLRTLFAPTAADACRFAGPLEISRSIVKATLTSGRTTKLSADDLAQLPLAADAPLADGLALALPGEPPLGALVFGRRWQSNRPWDDRLERLHTLTRSIGPALSRFAQRAQINHLHEALERAELALVSCSPDDRIVHWNGAAERLFGYAASETLGRPLPLFLEPQTVMDSDEDSRALETWNDQQLTERICFDKWRRRRAILSAKLPRADIDGQLIGKSLIAVERPKRTDEELRFRLTVEASPSAMVLVDRYGAITLVNSETERLFGYSRSELVGKHVETLLPEAMAERHAILRERFNQAPTQRPMGSGRELHGRHKNGTMVPIEIALNPLEIDGQPHVLSAIVDISDRQALLTRLRGAVEARDTFLSIASHELKTPLTALQLTVEGLTRFIDRQGGQTSVDERLREGLETSKKQVRRLTKLIDQLLDVSRITAGRLVLERDPLELNELVREVVDRFATEQTSIAIHAEQAEVSGSWDRSRIDQVLTNLISNAVKYGKGQPVDVAIKRQDNHAVLEVRDRGDGIAPEDQLRIFERFERVVSSRHVGGFGLGLWISRQIVSAHGGSIRVHSQPGKGSCFEVRLPLADPRD